MVSDELGKQLHDRATRGHALTAEEQAQLEVWYAAQDRAERAVLRVPKPDITVSLQAQIDAVLVRLAATTQRIQELTEENKALRREIAVLRRQGVRQTVLQPA